jgi:hypothetical protein
VNAAPTASSVGVIAQQSGLAATVITAMRGKLIAVRIAGLIGSNVAVIAGRTTSVGVIAM